MVLGHRVAHFALILDLFWGGGAYASGTFKIKAVQSAVQEVNAALDSLNSQLEPPGAQNCPPPTPLPAQSPSPLEQCMNFLNVRWNSFDEVRKTAQTNLNRGRATLPAGIELEEYIALLFYTGEGYWPLNKALRKGPPDSESVQGCKDMLNSALQSLPAYSDQFVFRGARIPNELLEKHEPESIIKYDAFTSSSSVKDLAFENETHFVIYSKQGRKIEELSDAPIEKEVLFSSPSCFKIFRRIPASELGDEEFSQKPWSQLNLQALYSKSRSLRNLILMEEVPCQK